MRWLDRTRYVTLVDALGDTSIGSNSVTVVSVGTVTVGAPAPATPFVGQAVNFTLTYPTTSGTPIARVVADFGDGTAPVTFEGAPGSIAHTFSKIGTFAVQVTPFDSLGNRGGTGSQTITVTSLPAPTFGSPSPASPTAGQSVTFPVTYATGTTSAIQRVVSIGRWPPADIQRRPVEHLAPFDQTKAFGITATLPCVRRLGADDTSAIAARPAPTVAIAINTTNPTADTDVSFTYHHARGWDDDRSATRGFRRRPSKRSKASPAQHLHHHICKGPAALRRRPTDDNCYR